MKKIYVSLDEEKDAIFSYPFKVFFNNKLIDTFSIPNDKKVSTVILRRVGKYFSLKKQELNKEIEKGNLQIIVCIKSGYSMILEDKPEILRVFEWYIIQFKLIWRLSVS